MFFPHPNKLKETALVPANINNSVVYIKLLSVAAFVLPGIQKTSGTRKQSMTVEAGQPLLLLYCYND